MAWATASTLPISRSLPHTQTFEGVSLVDLKPSVTKQMPWVATHPPKLVAEEHKARDRFRSACMYNTNALLIFLGALHIFKVSAHRAE